MKQLLKLEDQIEAAQTEIDNNKLKLQLNEQEIKEAEK